MQNSPQLVLRAARQHRERRRRERAQRRHERVADHAERDSRFHGVGRTGCNEHPAGGCFARQRLDKASLAYSAVPFEQDGAPPTVHGVVEGEAQRREICDAPYKGKFGTGRERQRRIAGGTVRHVGNVAVTFNPPLGVRRRKNGIAPPGGVGGKAGPLTVAHRRRAGRAFPCGRSCVAGQVHLFWNHGDMTWHSVTSNNW